MRRWVGGEYIVVAGLPFRVIEGRKAPGDLRLEWGPDSSWQPVPMAAAFLLVDFFTENEDHLTAFRPHWSSPGGDWFMGELQRARHHGWQSATALLMEQRRRREEPA